LIEYLGPTARCPSFISDSQKSACAWFVDRGSRFSKLEGHMLRLKLRISLTDRWNEDLPNPVGTVLEGVGDALYGIGLARVVPTPLKRIEQFRQLHSHQFWPASA
jgi:hypothetical protein